MKRIFLAGCLALGVLALTADMNSAQAQHGHHHRSSASCYRPDYRTGYGVYSQSLVVRPGFSYGRSSLYGPPLSPFPSYGLSRLDQHSHHHHHHQGFAPYGYAFPPASRPIGPGISLRIGF